MSGDKLNIPLPAEVARRPQERLDDLSTRFFSVSGRQVLQSDLSRASRWPLHSVLRLFVRLEEYGAARVEIRAFHSASGIQIAHYHLVDGPLNLPIDIDEEGYSGTIQNLDEVEFEISARILRPIVLKEAGV